MLYEIVKKRTLDALSMSNDDLEKLINEDRSCLHSPFLYDGMSELVDQLHEFKKAQDENPKLLLVVDTDYDTDGTKSATVLAAALDVFNINYRVYIPSMEDGYGLSVKAVNDIMKFETNGYRVGMILTADNGTNAVKGVEYAKSLGINVLVTDHHLGDDEEVAPADIIVNPNKVMPDGSAEPYPFKGNAGATVAWKAMLAYAERYRPDAYELIYDLVVFAGIANVADVMPIIDENHFMVKEATREFERLVKLRNTYGTSSLVYSDVKETIYPHYNAAFHGLYDLIGLLQESKDESRVKQNKKSIPLPTDEELISWYISPMINAPRRIHSTCREAMMAFLSTSMKTRHENIQAMIEMNNIKSELRNEILVEIHPEDLNENSNVLFVNSKHGISGLIAGQVAERTGNATIVFAYKTPSPTKIYSDNEFESRLDYSEMVISGSARSNPIQPLNEIIRRINEVAPHIVVGGGGHAAAAGYAIKYKYLRQFKQLFDKYAAEIREEMLVIQREFYEDHEPPVRNVVKLSFYPGKSTTDYAHVNVNEVDNLKTELMTVMDFQQSLKPFGKDFNGQTKFHIDIDVNILQLPEYRLDLNFWKTLKFFINGVTVLTFKEDLADMIKERIKTKNNAILTFEAELKPNEFNGVVSPQLILNRLV